MAPDVVYGPLFREVQLQKVFADGSIFVDMRPKTTPAIIMKQYREKKMNLKKFVTTWFEKEQEQEQEQEQQMKKGTNRKSMPLMYCNEQWKHMVRETKTKTTENGSLVHLPFPYLVPGGRFAASWYWDSYFTMLGIWKTDPKRCQEMVANFVYLIYQYGFIPSANRTYYLTRSQPPFLSHMVQLTFSFYSTQEALEQEYRFWVARRRCPRGELSRYYDNVTYKPRAESYAADVALVSGMERKNKTKMYGHIRAAAESGWDFSSRWFSTANSASSLSETKTADFYAVDLNSLLYHLCMTLAQITHSRIWKQKAKWRANLIRQYCWNREVGFFVDYDFVHEKQNPRKTLAGVFPLYCGLATKTEARLVSETLSNEFLKPGGLITTLENTGQQWDAPNGWAPLHWIAIIGLRKYGYSDLANQIKTRWLQTNETVFQSTGKFWEKYDVESAALGGGGEYEIQEGFGWTNGVFSALTRNEDLHPIFVY